MADDVTVIEGFGVGHAPVDYTLSGAQVLQVRAAFAKFDGTGASGPFLACIAFYAQDGKLFSRSYSPTAVAAGDTAEVSFAPFPGGLTGAAGRSGLQFHNGTYGPLNVGDWLDVETTDTTGSSASGYATDLHSHGGVLMLDDSVTGIQIEEDGAGGISIVLEPPGDGGITLGVQNSAATSGVTLQDSGTGGILLQTVTGGGAGTGGIFAHDNDAGGIKGISEGGQVLLKGFATTGAEPPYLWLFAGTPGIAILSVDPNPVLSHTGESLILDTGVGAIIYGGGNTILLDAGVVSTTQVVPEVRVNPVLRLEQVVAEPFLPAGTQTLYAYNDGSGHPKLKVGFGDTGVRVVLATG